MKPLFEEEREGGEGAEPGSQETCLADKADELLREKGCSFTGE